MTVKFKKWICEVSKGQYGNGNTALQLYDYEGLVATATVNMGIKLPEDQAYIKDYSENEGMVSALKEAGIVVGDAISFVHSGYVEIALYKLDLSKI